MRTISVGRCVAAFISLGTVANLLVREVDSVFVVPDVLVAAVLAIGAGLPGERTVPVLTGAFGLASGVFLIATSDRLAHDEAVIGTLMFALICAVMTVVFSWRIGLSVQQKALAMDGPIQVDLPDTVPERRLR